MKEISKALNKLPQKALKDFSARLNLKRSSTKEILSAFASISKLHSLLLTLEMDELRILKEVYKKGGGVTFGEIQKELDIEVSEIADKVENLSNNLLVYIMKNRQLLSNKLDKVYAISEISKTLNIVDVKTIFDRMNKSLLNLKDRSYSKEHIGPLKDEKISSLLRFIAESGCITTLDNAINHIGAKSFEKIISNLLKEKMLYMFHSYHPDFNTYLVLGDKIASYVSSIENQEQTKKKLNVFSRYNLIINLLNTYDTISTFGLFLTKQQNFRKIDMRRISEVMLEIKDICGKTLSQEEIAQLSLFLLKNLGCLKMNKDIVEVSLSNIQKLLGNPLKLVHKIIKSLKDPEPEDEYFSPPFDIPSYDQIKNIIKLLYELKETSYNYLKITMLARSFITMDIDSTSERLAKKENEDLKLKTAVSFLCIAGIVKIENNMFMLSDIGMQTANLILKLNMDEVDSKIEKNIYINADFTLIIPVNELDSETLYHLLAHTEIKKYDFIIHTMISKQSIIKTHKRGMTLDKFLLILKTSSKNELPQNLDFLLKEWSNQTVNITISQNILLKSSHPAFLDEWLIGKNKDGIIERISENYIIIKKDLIDEIIKMARKKDAVISLFESSESDESD